jgi:hypothetical protein
MINALAAFLTLFGIFLVAWFDYQAWEMSPRTSAF